MGSNDNLENLVRSGGLKSEPPDRKECEGLLGLSKARVRLFALCHERRNRAEYEGYMNVDEPLLAELLAATDALLMSLVEQAMPVGQE